MMTNWTVVFFATLAFQGSFGAVVKYDDDFKFINLWNEIELEIKGVVLRLENAEPSYLKNLVLQCQNLSKVIETVINQLQQETIAHEQGDIIFKRVMSIFQDVRNSLKNLELSDIKNKLVYHLERMMEHMEQLVFIGKTYCPQLRALLRTILVDFLKFVQSFRTPNGILEQDVVIYESPERMVSQINIITKQFTDLLKGCNHMEEMRIVLRNYIRYVEEIIHKLEDKPDLGDQADLLAQTLVDELREMFVPLMKMIVQEEHVEVKVFRTELIAHFFSINSVFDQLVDMVDSEHCSNDVRSFFERIIYFYFYTIKQTHFEVRNAYKNSFYGSNYHEEFLDDKLSQNTSRTTFFNNQFEIESPDELLMRIQQLLQGLNSKDWNLNPLSYYVRDFIEFLEYVADKIAKEVRIHRLVFTKSVMNRFYMDLKQLKLKLEDMVIQDNIVKTELVRGVRQVFVGLYKIVVIEKMQDNGYEHLLLKDVCIKFYNFLNDVLYKMDIYDYNKDNATMKN